jgi:transcriptional/translational regulatory protein YebC/TACO1
VRETLEANFGEPNQAELVWRPQNTVPLDEEKAETLFRLMEALDESDDVQSVAANYDIDEATLERLTA